MMRVRKNEASWTADIGLACLAFFAVIFPLLYEVLYVIITIDTKEIMTLWRIKNMLTRPISYPVSGWSMVDDDSETQNNESTGRKEVNIVIGEIRNENREVIQYVIEPMYADILTLLLGEERKDCTLFQNLNQTPKLIIKYKNSTIIHNGEFEKHYQAIQNAIDDIATDVIMSALADAKNKTARKKKGDGLKALEALIKTKTGVTYHTELILYALRRSFMETEEDPLRLHDKFNSMSQEEIVDFIAAVREYEISEETRNKVLGELLKENDINVIQESMNKIVTTRYLLGLLR